MTEKSGSKWENALYTQIIEAGLPEPEKEYKFHPVRRWRIDFAFPEHWVAVEVEGGSFGAVVVCPRCKSPVMITRKDGRRIPVRQAGRHNDPKGFEADCEKYNELALMGWMLLRITPKLIKERKAIELIQRALSAGQVIKVISDNKTNFPIVYASE